MMLMSSLKRSIAVMVPLAAVCLAGCNTGGQYSDRNYEYYHAKMTNPIQLPATRDQAAYKDLMPVPNASQAFVAPKGHFEVPAPYSSNQAQQGSAPQQVEVKSANGQRWLVVPGAPGKVWPKLLDFAQDNANVDSATPAKGEIATDRYTIAVRQGQAPDSTEVFCLTDNTTNQQCVSDLDNALSANANQ